MYTSLADLLSEIKNSGKDWIKSQIKVSALTFLLVMIGLFIADAVCEKKYGSGFVPDALIPLIAIFIATVDAIPVLGVSITMLPWAALETIFAEPRTKGLAILLVFICVMVIKQISEPFIRGKTLGVSPLEEVAAAAAGWVAFSFLGALGSGLGVIVVPILYTVGKKVYISTHSQTYFTKQNERRAVDGRRSGAVDITDEVEDVTENE
ncbi:MAG: AI-2E family transporter [Clostridia bacterium]|nr:AI-2E family transporter [Clostridia bacterium]MBR5015821.1 AI-2E family transporter [Clostridia bacterium]MBR6480041.1 AI-2E family transporter [Clostridia bacterium]MBR6512102.1 AI-2E family transporter [Clostridia bacterium]